MKRKIKTKRFKQAEGFGLVEIMLAVSVFALFVVSLAGALIYGRENAAIAGAKARAVFIAEEGLEAARNIRDAGFGNLTAGSHGLAVSEGQWIFSGTQDVTDAFTRQVTISNIDANRKLITSLVSWQQTPYRSGTVSSATYLVNLTAGAGWTNPFLQSSLDLAGLQNGLKIQTRGDYAYVVRNDGSPDFAIINVASSTAPLLAGSLNLSGAPTNVAVAGDYAYISSESDTQELQIVNISNPALPSLAGTYNASGSADALGIYATGTTAYLVRSLSGAAEFLIINAANPAAPSLAGSLNLDDTGSEAVILGNYAYVSSYSNSQELQVVNITNPALPVLAGSYDLSGTQDVLSIAGFDNVIILGRANNFIYTFDVSVPGAPVLSASFNAQGSVNDISLGADNTLAFLATGSGSAEFQVIDITALAAPATIGSLNLSIDLLGIAYGEAQDKAFAVSSADTQEFAVFAPQ